MLAASLTNAPKKPAPFSLTDRQHEGNRLLGGEARHVMLYGGSRSGKTFLTVRAIIVRALKAEGSRHAVFRFRFNHVVRSIGLDTLPKVMALCFPGVAYTIDRTEWIIRFPNKSEIWLCGLDDKERAEKVLGQEFATVYFNESSQIPYASVLMAITRLAQRTALKLRAYYDCNPPGTGHWSYKVFIEKRDPKSKTPFNHPENYTSLVMNPGDNRANLDPDYIKELENLPERQRKRFLEGRFVSDLDNALWTLETIDACRWPKNKPLPDMRRVVIAVDPSGAAGDEDKRSDAIGISACGQGVDGKFYVLEDATLTAGPGKWARRAILAYQNHKADKIVAEINYGGAMVTHTINTEDKNVKVEVITASRGKVVRAEPIAALYEKGMVFHACKPEYGDLNDLEDEMVNFTTAGYMGDRSPNRADALVWALSDLSQAPVVQYGGLC